MILGGGFNIFLCSALGVRFPCSLPWNYGRKSDIFERVVQPPTMCISYLYIYINISYILIYVYIYIYIYLHMWLFHGYFALDKRLWCFFCSQSRQGMSVIWSFWSLVELLVVFEAESLSNTSCGENHNHVDKNPPFSVHGLWRLKIDRAKLANGGISIALFVYRADCCLLLASWGNIFQKHPKAFQQSQQESSRCSGILTSASFDLAVAKTDCFSAYCILSATGTTESSVGIKGEGWSATTILNLFFVCANKKDVPSDFHHFLRVHSVS